MKILDGGLENVKGFMFAGIHAGVKKSKKDIAVIVSENACAAAGAFTLNKVQAAPVVYDKEIIGSGAGIRGIVVNSGNANACTGPQGLTDTKAMAESLAAEIGNADAQQILVCSTGVIGVPLPMPIITKGIKQAVSEMGDERPSAGNAAEAILTTDTFTKEIAVEVMIDGKPVTVAGIAKGSGMIHPNMATLLSFIITDANVDAAVLQQLLGNSVSTSYNMISVDGDTSTNDTVLALANRTSGTAQLTDDCEDSALFKQAFDYVHAYLAKQIVRDGEGASKFIEAAVSGAASDDDAALMAKSIITSNLVKTAMFGEDANWGRILCAMGYSTADFTPESARLTISSDRGSLLLLEQGAPIPFNEDEALKVLGEHDIRIDVSLQDGAGQATAWGCDLSYEYVKINGEYRT